jgi:hypothetical protein
MVPVERPFTSGGGEVRVRPIDTGIDHADDDVGTRASLNRNRM